MRTMKQMIFKTKEGEFDFTNKKVRLNGKVLDKFSLCASMERLDFKRFQFATLYTYDVCNYETIKGELYDYLTENEVTETETTTNESETTSQSETTTNESDEITTTTNESEKSDYLKLWDDFKKKWHFSTLGSIGSYVIFGNYNDITLSKYVRDKRYTNGLKMVEVYTTNSYDDMRDYLTTHYPIVTL